MTSESLASFWALSTTQAFEALAARASGLTEDEAAHRLAIHGRNALDPSRRRGFGRALLRQLSNPLAWLLVVAIAVSSVAREWTDAGVVCGILLLSAVLGALQERRAQSAVDALRSRLELRADVIRDGRARSIPSSELVPGDIVSLSAGSVIPADALVLEARDFFVSEAVLTGESLPVEKHVDVSSPDAPITRRTNAVFTGSSVRSGSARVLVVGTGQATEYGKIAQRLALRAPDTEFDRGLRSFGHLLTRFMFVLVMFTTAANILGRKPAMDSMLFAIALAVGLAPEMLPAVVAINLARGARRMAARGVVVRRISAIENFGSMDVLCTDKTGTLTEGNVALERAVDTSGVDAPRVLRLAYWNAALQTGLTNALDRAIVDRAVRDAPSKPPEKVDEIPYDFRRKRLAVVVRDEGEPLLVVKGAASSVFDVCTSHRGKDDVQTMTDDVRRQLVQRVDDLGGEGIRVLAVATRRVPLQDRYAPSDESQMTLEGLLELRDLPKEGVGEVIRDLSTLGIEVKIVSGDSLAVARHLAKEIGVRHASASLTGAEVATMRDEALWHRAERTGVFAEVDPNQKERIIRALAKTGHVVGYMGDGINDAPALHASDVGISVDEASDVARDAAEFVLLRRDLRVLHDGVLEGRVTFANTMKYLFTTESANFGNMVSMALAAAFLPFLPLLATQVLLNNFLSDVPAMAIAGDRVDREQLERPLRWNLRLMKRFMIVFGLVSSAFDLLTFGTLLLMLRATPAEFRSAWFLESLLTELAVALVVRTRRPLFRSRPSGALIALSVACAVVAFVLPLTPLGRAVELVPLPASWAFVLVTITLLYVTTVEVTKHLFFRRQAS